MTMVDSERRGKQRQKGRASQPLFIEGLNK
uniref:Uncharacterized protein n=1 Tax=Tetranychus urticae TaxID=32264 RepID=T1L1W4_TETUR